MKQDMIVILDLGCTENTATARAIRALGVYSEIYPHDVTPEELAALPNVKGVILNGGPNRVVDGVSIDAAPEIYACGLPVLAVCHPAAQAHTDRAQVFVRKEPWPQEEAAVKKELESFVFGKCQAQANWNMENFIADQIDLVRRQVGDKKVLLALSGGVDSSVVAALLLKAIGNQLTCVHVNHGLLRKGEPEQVVEVFRNQMNANLVYVDASERFLSKLAGVADPEQKRKIIGAEFIRVFEEEARKLEGIDFLAQARSTRISSRAARKPLKWSNLIITLAACRRIWRLSSLSRCASSLRMRCALVAWPWACQTAWSTASLSRARPRRALPRRDHARPVGGRAGIRCDFTRGVSQCRARQKGVAVFYRRAGF